MKHASQQRTRHRQRGASLLLMVIIAALIFFGLFSIRSPVSLRTDQESASAAVLAQAKAALIGYAATYKETHPGELAGYLPCPDTNNDGEYTPADDCGLKDVSVVGRLPWKTLGLPPLRDGDGECLWYAVSGRAKNDHKADVYNWDTPGQFVVQTPSGQVLAGATPHARPLAVIFSAGRPINGQNRSAGGGECPGSAADAAAAYLEGIGALGTGNTTITVADAVTRGNGTNNDSALWVTSADIFGPIRKRSDFKTDVEAMLNNVANHLNTLTPLALPATSTNKGVGDPIAETAGSLAKLYLDSGVAGYNRNFFKNWSSNLLYAKLASPVKVNGESGCYAVLVFGGERLPAQSRDPVAPSTEADTTSNYLEAPLLGVFGTSSDQIGPTDFVATTPNSDLIRCIKGLTPPAMQASFASDFANFGTTGTPGAAVADSGTQTLDLLDASGSSGGCFWYGNPIPLAGRTIRSYYTFRFATADDPFAVPDLRYGFTVQMVGDIGDGVPIDCGTEFMSGALPQTNKWGTRSLIVETDIYETATRNDPPGNHTAIMKNGSIVHAPGGYSYGAGAPTACNGTSNLCLHTPIDTFEESPSPLTHNQRMEITTGCNSSCGTCAPGLHADPNTFAKVSVWVDCSDCSDVAVAINRVTKPPTVEICSDLNPSGDTILNQIYIGFTGGFSSTYPNAVSIRDFVLRSE